MSDSELVDRIQAGDASAFHDLYLRHVAVVYQYIRSHIASDQESEALTAAVFVDAWQAITSRAWLATSSQAEFMRLAHQQLVEFQSRSAHDELVPAGPGSRGARRRAWSELRPSIQQAMTGLEDDDRTILHLRYVAGYEVEEIAGILNETSQAVRAAQRRALGQLRRAIKHVRLPIEEELLGETPPASTG